VLTVDYDRLELRPGDLLLDLGCGAGRHAFESFRKGARVVAFDYSLSELQEVRGLFEAMREVGEAPTHGTATATNGDAVRLPFADGSFDRIIASEVLEHIPNDIGALDELVRVLRPGGVMAVTIPAWLPETICWRLSDEYHAPFVQGGHVRIYTEVELRTKMDAAGLEPGGAHHAHALHAPYWWLKCAVGPTNDDHPLVHAYHRLLVWDITSHPWVLQVAEKALQPLIGKSLVVYARKPLETVDPQRAHDSNRSTSSSTPRSAPAPEATHAAA
jgi:SAM-dependent methyltransferase